MQKYLYLLSLVLLFAFGAGCTTTNQTSDNTANTSVSDEGREIYPDDMVGGEEALDDNIISADEVEEDSTAEESDDEFAEDDTDYYTMEEVAMHSIKEDCWFVIDEVVYDVTDYDKHPGEDAIYEGCGKDATNLFETRPMGSGTPHSDKARGYMVNYEIGDLE